MRLDWVTYDLNLVTGEMITSRLFANIFGFKEIVSRSEYVSVFHMDDLEIREKAHKEALVTGKLFYEARVVWPDKSIHWTKVEGKVYYNDKNEAIRILGTLLDTTEQKLAKEEQRKLITLVANSVDLMSILNMDGTKFVHQRSRQKIIRF